MYLGCMTDGRNLLILLSDIFINSIEQNNSADIKLQFSFCINVKNQAKPPQLQLLSSSVILLREYGFGSIDDRHESGFLSQSLVYPTYLRLNYDSSHLCNTYYFYFNQKSLLFENIWELNLSSKCMIEDQVEDFLRAHPEHNNLIFKMGNDGWKELEVWKDEVELQYII